MVEQLSLAVNIPDDEVFSSFVAGSNDQIVLHLQDLLIDPNLSNPNQLTYISGDTGTGKSHLLYALCHEAQVNGRSQFYIGLKNLTELSAQMLTGLEGFDVICVDDIDRIQASPQWQLALFDLINRVKESQHTQLVLTANAGPAALHIDLSDLQSRLSWGIAYHLQPLEENHRVEALITRAAKRGMHLSKDVGRYLVTHCRQDMHTVMRALDTLDRSSLQEQRRLTIPFVKEILNI